jgi:hypothetical protein
LVRPSCQIGPAGSGVARRAHYLWSLRGGQAHGGAAGPGSPTDKVSQGRWHEHHGGGGNTPAKVAGGGGSPERRVDGEGEEGRRLIDVPRRWWGLVVGEGGDEVLQPEEETGEVRHGLKGVDGGGTMELTEGGEEAVAAVQPPAWMRGRGMGRGACGALQRENGGGEERGAAASGDAF